VTRGRGAAAVAAFLLVLALSVLGPGAASAAGPPRLSARAAILVETSTGDVLYQDHAGQRRPIASTTKLMTALLALDEKKLTDRITSPGYNGLAVESTIGLQRGERLTVADLLTGMLLASGNDAAQTVAVGVAGSVPAFVAQMNRRAKSLDMTNTHYANPIGLDAPGAYSSAADLVKLTLELRRKAFFRATTDRPVATLDSGRHVRVVHNRNLLVGRYPEVTGVKTGHTQKAGYVLVGSATRGGVSVISAVLGEPSEDARDIDTLALLRYGLRSYHRVEVFRARQRLKTVKAKDASDTVALVAARAYGRVVRNGLRPRLTIRSPAEIEGPVRRGARMGTAVISVGGAVVALVPLVTTSAVPAPSKAKKLADRLGGAGTLAIAGLLLALLAATLVRRRRRPGARAA
jgi:D-alanyl-D-alanine carboxypeptidase (penicillin-binding protein 5/6)